MLFRTVGFDTLVPINETDGKISLLPSVSQRYSIDPTNLASHPEMVAG
jgi:hypothetical protein